MSEGDLLSGVALLIGCVGILVAGGLAVFAWVVRSWISD